MRRHSLFMWHSTPSDYLVELPRRIQPYLSQERISDGCRQEFGTELREFVLLRLHKCLGALEKVRFFLLFLIVYLFPLALSFFIISNHLPLLERKPNCQQKSVALSSH
uniref:Uncharacterized protein n=1 Tax=Nelumbo nucifera TaxID=4432 RepID=A0A823A5W1_NELNU|nr:TPA_asm: hypothetical protein HUJ06_019105 [Nelumbo nucifera]